MCSTYSNKEALRYFSKALVDVPSNVRDDMCQTILETPRESELIVKRQNARLEELRHASRCDKKKCTEINNCQHFRELWIHIVTCNAGNECSYPDCIGSKYVLSKYAQYMRSCHFSPKMGIEKSTSSRKRSFSGNIRDFGTDSEAANILYNMVSPKSSSEADTSSESSCTSDSDEEAATILLGFSTPKNEEKKSTALEGFKRTKLLV